MLNLPLLLIAYITGDPEEDCKDTLIFGVAYTVLLVLFVWFFLTVAEFLNGH
jgi:hypothetical protein